MAKKPEEITKPTIHTYWDKGNGLICPLCNSQIRFAFNDGGRKVVTLKGPIWVVENYYRCTNKNCELHESIPMVYGKTIERKKFDLGVWGKVIMWHFTIHLNYEQIVQLMWREYHVTISQGTVAAICEYFKGAGMLYMDQVVLGEVKKNGKIVLSTDGAQPIKGEPSLWEFTDRISGHVLCFRQLPSATAEILAEIYNEIEEKYGVPIVAVISDKQKNIVNSVKIHNPKLPHVYCQYHFLAHIAEGINAKDSHLGTQLGKEIKKASIIINHRQYLANNKESNELSPGVIFKPLAEELLCAIAAKGDRFNTFAGVEIYKNLEFIMLKLKDVLRIKVIPHYKRTLTTTYNYLTKLLKKWEPLKNEVEELVPYFRDLRDILGRREWDSKKIKSYINSWKKPIIDYLKWVSLPHKPSEIKYKAQTHESPKEEIFQQWIRLENSYKDGIYLAYDDPLLDFTNNSTEQIFHVCKSHFKSVLGRQNVSEAFQKNGGPYSILSELDYEDEKIYEVLLASETALVEGYVRELHALYAKTRRNWRIREINTGNLSRLKENLKKVKD